MRIAPLLLLLFSLLACSEEVPSPQTVTERVTYTIVADSLDMKPYIYDKDCPCWFYPTRTRVNSWTQVQFEVEYPQGTTQRHYALKLKALKPLDTVELQFKVDGATVLDSTFVTADTLSPRQDWFTVHKYLN